LESQSFQHGAGLLVIATTAGLAENAVTWYVNGLLDLGKRIKLDQYDFLNVVPADDVQLTQAKGRVGRVCTGLVFRLPCDESPPVTSSFALSYSQALTQVAAAKKLTVIIDQEVVSAPCIGISPERMNSLSSDLYDLGVTSGPCPDDKLTVFGEAVVWGRMDIRGNVLKEFARILGVPDHGAIALAAISCHKDCFVYEDVPRQGGGSWYVCALVCMCICLYVFCYCVRGRGCHMLPPKDP
jgi:hypothetical protein